MTPITSPHNPKLKQLRKLAHARERAATRLFVAEGEDLVWAAQAAGRSPVYGFSTPGLRLDGFGEIAPELLAGVSTLGSGTRAIGVYEQRYADSPLGPICVYLHGVGDPGNVGAVLRSALAFGASSVALGPGCADPHSPKAVRASMGAIFSLPLARVPRIEELPGRRVALVAHAGEPLSRVADLLAGGAPDDDFATVAGVRVIPPPGLAAIMAPSTLLVGAERDGLPRAVVDACEHIAHIPIAGESLNAAMAATVALYEMTRQRAAPPEIDGQRGPARRPPDRVPKS
jgi:TrmH family RNA methyltransferase